MTPAQLYEQLKGLNIPVAYRMFKSEQSLPYVVYYFKKDKYGADNSGNLVCRYSVTIELYTSKKDTQLESQIEAILNMVDFEGDENIVNDNEIMTTYNYEFMEVI